MIPKLMTVILGNIGSIVFKNAFPKDEEGNSKHLKFWGFVWSKARALEKLEDGQYELSPKETHIHLIFSIKDRRSFAYFEEQHTFVDPETFVEVQKQGSWFVDFDGNDDSIEFTNDGGYLVFGTKPWSIGVTMLLKDMPVDNAWLTIFQNGQNRVILRRGGSNMGVYISATTDHATWGANTWFEFQWGDKLLCTWDPTAKKLKVYTSRRGLSYWSVVVPASVWDIPIPVGGEPSGNFSIGKSINDVGNYWGATSYKHFYGGFNNFIGSNKILGDVAINQYLSVLSTTVEFTPEGVEYVAGDSMDKQDFYVDLTTWCKLGEGEYPNIVDQKKLLTGGTFTGAEKGFKQLT